MIVSPELSADGCDHRQPMVILQNAGADTRFCSPTPSKRRRRSARCRNDPIGKPDFLHLGAASSAPASSQNRTREVGRHRDRRLHQGRDRSASSNIVARWEWKSGERNCRHFRIRQQCDRCACKSFSLALVSSCSNSSRPDPRDLLNPRQPAAQSPPARSSSDQCDRHQNQRAKRQLFPKSGYREVGVSALQICLPVAIGADI